MSIVAFSFLFPIAEKLPRFLLPYGPAFSKPIPRHVMLAKSLNALGISGNVAGPSWEGVYVAYLLDTPHYTVLDPTLLNPDNLRANGVSLLMVPKEETAIMEHVLANSQFWDVTGRLRPELSSGDLKVFEIRKP
jgi:hypothetical protein